MKWFQTPQILAFPVLSSLLLRHGNSQVTQRLELNIAPSPVHRLCFILELALTYTDGRERWTLGISRTCYWTMGRRLDSRTLELVKEGIGVS